MKIRFDSAKYECVLRDGFSEADTLYVNHCHPLYEIIMVVCGKIAINIENRRFAVSAGEIVMVKPAEYHIITSLDASEYRRFTLLFDPSLLPVEIREGIFSKIAISPVLRHEDMPQLFKRLDMTMRREDVGSYAPLIDALITELFYAIYEAEELPAESQDDRAMQAVLEYIGGHITERIMLDEVAACALVSKSSVCHMFKSRMNISMKQYILQKKIAYAAELIKSGTSASAAAEAVGYENYAGFYKMYKKFLLSTPTKRS